MRLPALAPLSLLADASFSLSQYEHQVLKKINDADDEVPAFHEWATVQPGMICLARKKRTAQYR